MVHGFGLLLGHGFKDTLDLDLDLDPIQSDGLGHGYGFTGTLDLDLDLDSVIQIGFGYGYIRISNSGLDWPPKEDLLIVSSGAPMGIPHRVPWRAHGLPTLGGGMRISKHTASLLHCRPPSTVLFTCTTFPWNRAFTPGTKEGGQFVAARPQFP